MSFRNAVTQCLSGATEYDSGQAIEAVEAYRYSQRGCDVVFIFFSGKYGLISVQGLNELSQLLDAIANDSDIRGIILTDNNAPRGDKPHMSFRGLDIKTEFVSPFEKIATGDEQPMRRLLDAGQSVVEQIAQYPKPIAGVVAGDIYGGGVELLAFTYLIVGEGMEMAVPECRLNVPQFLSDNEMPLELGDKRLDDPYCLFPGWHGHRSLLHRMGERGRCSKETAVIMNDRFVFEGMKGKTRAQTAQWLGMVDEVHPVDKLRDAAVRYIYIQNLEAFERRELDRWSAPQRPADAPRDAADRGTLGAVACDHALYDEHKGSWRDAGNRDAVLMIGAMREAMIS